MTASFNEIVYFEASNKGSSTPRLGRDSSKSTAKDYVLRLKFTAPNTGASSFQFELNNAYWFPIEDGHSLPNDHNSSAYFLYAISESDSEYINYNHDNAESPKPYDGVVLVKDDNSVDLSESGFYTLYCDSLKKILMPGRTYYLWLFPNFHNHYYYWYFGNYFKNSYNLEGSAGVIRIKEGNKELITIPTVKENGKFVELAATIKSGDHLIYCI